MLYYRCTHSQYFTSSSPFFFDCFVFVLFHPGFFVILILMYAFIVLVFFLIVKRILMLIMRACKSLWGIALYKSYYYY